MEQSFTRMLAGNVQGEGKAVPWLANPKYLFILAFNLLRVIHEQNTAFTIYICIVTLTSDQRLSYSTGLARAGIEIVYCVTVRKQVVLYECRHEQHAYMRKQSKALADHKRSTRDRFLALLQAEYNHSRHQ